MFLNQYHHSFDDKARLTIPSKFRDLPEEGVVVIQGLDRNLMVLPSDAFKKLYERVMATNLADPSARLLRRITLGNALPVVPDGAREPRFWNASELPHWSVALAHRPA